jgi:cell wall-associated NlpC family hydrolase
MGAPAATLGAQVAFRYRKQVIAALIALGLIVVLPVLGIVASVGGSIGGQYRASPVAIADIPATYLALYQRTAAQDGIDWAILAAVGKIECDHGRNTAPGCRPYTANSAGAVGPMQFRPTTWRAGQRIGETRVSVPPAEDGQGYASDGDGDGVADIWDPADAIASAARLLVANGAPSDYRRALFAYNHASWYVDDVLRQAQAYRGAWAGATAGAGPIGAWAENYLGTPYVWGANHGVDPSVMLGLAQPQIATGRDGRAGYFDCSSLASWAYAKGAGIYIGDATDQQWAYGATAVGAHRGTGSPPGGFLPGDLVFFDAFDHVGIYVGDDLFVQSPHTGANVEISRLSTYGTVVGWVRYDQVSGGVT